MAQPLTRSYPLPPGLGKEGMHRVLDWLLEQEGVQSWTVDGAELRIVSVPPEPESPEADLDQGPLPLLAQLSPYEIFQRCPRINFEPPAGTHPLARLIECLHHPQGLLPLMILIPQGARLLYQAQLGKLLRDLGKQTHWFGVEVSEDSAVAPGKLIVFYGPPGNSGLVSTRACRIVELVP